MTVDMTNSWLFECPRCVVKTIAMSGEKEKGYVTKDSTSVPESEKSNKQVPDIAYKDLG